MKERKRESERKTTQGKKGKEKEKRKEEEKAPSVFLHDKTHCFIIIIIIIMQLKTPETVVSAKEKKRKKDRKKKKKELPLQNSRLQWLEEPFSYTSAWTFCLRFAPSSVMSTGLSLALSFSLCLSLSGPSSLNSTPRPRFPAPFGRMS